MSAPTVAPLVMPFTATRAQACGSAWECNGVQVGEPAAYVGGITGAEGSPAAVCGPCVTHMTGAAETAETQPVEQESDADRAASAAHAEWVTDSGTPLCTCTHRGPGSGFHHDPATGLYVHTCGKPAALPEGSTAPNPGEAGPLPEGDDPAEHDETPGVEDVHECGCTRVTKRASFGRTADGRPTHEHCGGVLREKHRHLAPGSEAEQTERDTDGEAQTDDRDDKQPAGGEPDPGAGPGAGLPARGADGGARAGAGGGEERGSAGEGDHRGDQGGDLADGTRRGDPAQPARDPAVEAVADGIAAAGHEAAAPGHPGLGAGPVRGGIGVVAPGRDGLSGLAAFYAQPVEDEAAAWNPSPAPVHPLAPVPADRPGLQEVEPRPVGNGRLAAFYAQPVEDPWAPVPQEMIERDRADRQARTLDELGQAHDGAVAGLVLVGPDGQTRIVWVGP